MCPTNQSYSEFVSKGIGGPRLELSPFRFDAWRCGVPPHTYFCWGPTTLWLPLHSRLGACVHAIPNGRPRQLGMTEHVVHARVIGFVPNVHTVIDVFPLIQLDFNVQLFDGHLLGDILVPIYIGTKPFNIQHVFHIPSHRLTNNQVVWQYPHGHVTVWVINLTLGVWAFDKLPYVTNMASHLVQKCSLTTCIKCGTKVEHMCRPCDVLGCEICQITL